MDDFETDILVEDSISGETTVPTTAAPAPVPAPVETPPAPSIPPTPTPPAPTAPTPPAPPAPVTPTPAPVAPSPDPVSHAPVGPTPNEIATRRLQIVGEIEKRYGFTQEEQDKLLTEPHAVLPSMAAKLYVDVYEGVLQTIMSQLPRFLDFHQRQFVTARENEDAFYKEWPQLKRNDANHTATIWQLANVFRQTYPKATRDQFIKSVGAMASVQLGLPFNGAPIASPTPQKPTPFTPAGTASAGNSPPVSEENNPFADMLGE